MTAWSDRRQRTGGCQATRAEGCCHGGAADAGGIPARMTPLASAVAAIGAAMRRLEYTNMDSPELGTGVVSKADVGD